MTDHSLDAILLVYHRPVKENAPTIMEYVNAFPRHSRYPVVSVNTEFGFPSFLQDYRFDGILLHYSLFALWPYQLNKRFLAYLASSPRSYKLAIFQDEYRYCQPRFQFINQYGIRCIYTCIAPEYYPDFYNKYTRAGRIESVLTGYVSEELIRAAATFFKPDVQRRIDIGYRAQPLPFYMGRGAQEKTEIAAGFLARARKPGLLLDVKTGEQDRIYGDGWYEFLSDCRGVLGVESGVSFCDIEDRVRPAVEALLAQYPDLGFDQVYERVLKPWEGNLPIRTISPRHFEAAALRVCQILFEGEYAGIMQPMVHYIPLKKDFSNFDDVIRLFRDPQRRGQITENAYRDLIASGRYSYRTLVERTDRILEENGLTGAGSPELLARLRRQITRWEGRRRPFKMLEQRIRSSQIGQRIIKPMLRPVLAKIGIPHPGS
jgi:hypothetical protein